MIATAAAEARALRAKGWSIPGLARRFEVGQAAIALALGEKLVGRW